MQCNIHTKLVFQRLKEYIDQGKLVSLDPVTAHDLLDWQHRWQNIEDGSDDWMQTCGVGSLEFENCSGDTSLVWKRGYSVLFDILMARARQT